MLLFYIESNNLHTLKCTFTAITYKLPFLVLFCLLLQFTILDVFGGIGLPVYIPIPSLPPQCTLPLSKYPASEDSNP